MMQVKNRACVRTIAVRSLRASKMRNRIAVIAIMQLLDNVPRTVLATIIYKKHEAVRTDLFLPNQLIKQGCQTGG